MVSNNCRPTCTHATYGQTRNVVYTSEVVSKVMWRLFDAYFRRGAETAEGRTGGPAVMRSWIISRNCLIVVSALCSVYLLAFYFNVDVYGAKTFRRLMSADRTVTNTTKKILYWNTMFGNDTFYLGNSFRNCPVSDCYATHDRNYANLTDFDAVLFHGNELRAADLPASRSPRQWYVFVNLESPANRPLLGYYYEDYFNLTMTYRLDSDVVWTYGVVKETATGRIVAPLPNTTWTDFYNRTGDWNSTKTPSSLWKRIEGKTKPIVWFVSNCQAKSGREKYIAELANHVGVDIYGKCGDYACPRDSDCFGVVAEPNYFFYLSFENSLCEDYVTEKLYNPLSYDLVPIVYGGANYSVFAPPGSYIDALDFDSPKELAKYLKALMKNRREYAKYFEWKKHYRVDRSSRRAACNLCEFLHEQLEPRSYKFLSQWYSLYKCPLQEVMGAATYLTGGMLKNQG
ncbi:alpha-(1,3)-fucosyltransferase C isoform X2 [Megalopta genalis]|uniref:alpha-(1,3)-fucosyltransferase C isoform X2 n=1 Tax=Megalopta genalis TaxID=115081 RepID=UPI003FD450C5